MSVNQYYEGILQLRNPSKEIINKTRSLINKRKDIWIANGDRMSLYASKVLVPGDPTPAIQAGSWLNTEDGSTPPDLNGKVVMLDFSATWCGPCVRSMPHVQAVYEKYAEKGLLGVIATDESKEVFEPYATQNGITMPVALKVPRSNTHGDFGVAGWPSLFLIDRAGKCLIALAASAAATYTYFHSGFVKVFEQ